MKIQELIIVVILFVFVGCTSNKKKKKEIHQEQKAPQNEKVIKVFSLGNKNSNATAELIRNSHENSITIQTKRDDFLLAKSGYGNSDFQINDKGGSIKIDTVQFNKFKSNAYVIYTYIKGSTFGAGFNYIIYKKDEWAVMRLPFLRSKISDVDADGYKEIINFTSTGDKTTYYFRSGLVYPANR